MHPRSAANSANASRSRAGWWDDARVAALVRMWAKRARVKDIAEHLGTTGNAVIGKAHRLGLKPYSREECAKHTSIGMRAAKLSRVPRETSEAAA